MSSPPTQVIPCGPPRRPRGLYWNHLDPATISAIPALKNHLSRPDKPDKTAHRQRDANTQSGCQFASQHASPCAFLLRLVTPAPLFTLADASLTLPMGSQTDTSRRSIERLSGAAGRAECGAAPEEADTRPSAGRVTTHCRVPTAIRICPGGGHEIKTMAVAERDRFPKSSRGGRFVRKCGGKAWCNVLHSYGRRAEDCRLSVALAASNLPSPTG